VGKLFKISQKTLNLPAGYYPLCPQCQQQRPRLESHPWLDNASLPCHHLPPPTTTFSPCPRVIFIGDVSLLCHYLFPSQQHGPRTLIRKLSPMDNDLPQQPHSSSPINDNNSLPVLCNPSPINDINDNLLLPPPPPPYTFSIGRVLINGVVLPACYDACTTGTSHHHTTTCTPASPLHQADSTSLSCPPTSPHTLESHLCLGSNVSLLCHHLRQVLLLLLHTHR